MKPIFFLSFIFLCSCTATPDNFNQEKDNRPLLERMPSMLQAGKTDYQIDPTRDTLLRINARGTNLYIPKNCFQNQDGSPVTKAVKIEFQEYTNAAEIAFSGIPMTYNIGGEDLAFNSSGMFKIDGTSEGNPIEVSPDKQMEIDYTLAKKNADIDFYKLDDECREWQILEEIKPVGDTSQSEQSRPCKKGFCKDRVVKIDFATKDIFPEFQQYDNTEFRVSEKSQFDAKDTAATWFSFDITTTDTENEYAISYTGLDVDQNWIEGTYIVTPVYEGVDYKLAMEKWRAKYNMVATKKGQIQKEEEARVKEMEARQEQWLKEQKELAKERQSQSEKRRERSLVQNTASEYPNVVRGLPIPSFGTYNCDRLIRMQNRIVVNASYFDSNNKPIQDGSALAVIDMSLNSAFSYYPERFTCDSKANNVLVLFTKSNRVYILDKGEFQKMGISKSDVCKIPMKDITSKINCMEDLVEYLGFVSVRNLVSG